MADEIKVIVEGVDINLSEAFTDADVKAAAESALALMKRRIVQKGKLASGEPLPEYSTEKIYIPLAGVGTGPPFAKPRGGNVVVRKDGKPAKTMRFDGGYKEFREKAGLGTQMNLTLSGNLMGKRFRVLSVRGLKAVVGWPSGSDSAIAAAGLDTRFEGDLFSWSAEEADAIVDVLTGALLSNLEKAGLALTPEEKAKVKVRVQNGKVD